jgi:hypothetical protein
LRERRGTGWSGSKRGWGRSSVRLADGRSPSPRPGNARQALNDKTGRRPPRVACPLALPSRLVGCPTPWLQLQTQVPSVRRRPRAQSPPEISPRRTFLPAPARGSALISEIRKSRPLAMCIRGGMLEANRYLTRATGHNPLRKSWDLKRAARTQQTRDPTGRSIWTAAHAHASHLWPRPMQRRAFFLDFFPPDRLAKKVTEYLASMLYSTTWASVRSSTVHQTPHCKPCPGAQGLTCSATSCVTFPH